MTTQCIGCGIESERFELPESQSRGLWGAVKRWWINHRRRSDSRHVIRYLRTLDDSLLKDLGINRGDIEWVGKLPTSSDATAELEIIARGGYGGFHGTRGGSRARCYKR